MRLKDYDGKPWPADKVNIALAHIRKQVIDDMNAADVQRAKASGIDLNATPDGILQTATVQQDGRNGHKYVVDPRASLIKHSGADTQYEVERRWRAFCEQPQDPGQFNIELPPLERKEPAIEERLGGSFSSLPVDVPNVEPEPVSDDPPAAVPAEALPGYCVECNGIRHGRGYKHAAGCSLKPKRKR
jgi:hypothetical protein